MPEDLYAGREQSRAKHALLELYLEGLAYKILMAQRPLVYIDGFAGPWQAEGPNFEDTSFAIALDKLAQARVTAARNGRAARIRCIFNERSNGSFRRLSEYAERARHLHRQIQIDVCHGKFADNAEQIDRLAGDGFRFVFIDPTGWTGFPLDAVRTALGDKGELLLNFMSSHAQRWLPGTAMPQRDGWLADLIGREAAAALKGRETSIDELREALLNALRTELGFEYACATPITAPTESRVQFWLLYGTRSAAGVEVFRDAEAKAIAEHEIGRATDFGKQSQLFEPEARGMYSNLHEHSLDHLEDRCRAKLPSAGPGIEFSRFAASVMEREHVRLIEVKDACIRLAEQGAIERTWKQRNSRARKPSKGDFIRRTEP